MTIMNANRSSTTKSKVTGRLRDQQKGFVVLLLLLVILLAVMTPVGCATLLAVLAGTGAAAAP